MGDTNKSIVKRIGTTLCKSFIIKPIHPIKTANPLIKRIVRIKVDISNIKLIWSKLLSMKIIRNKTEDDTQKGIKLLSTSTYDKISIGNSGFKINFLYFIKIFIPSFITLFIKNHGTRPISK